MSDPELAQLFEYVYGKPIFTRLVFEQAHRAANRVRDGTEKYHICDVRGQMHKVRVDKEYEEGCNVQLRYRTYLEMAKLTRALTRTEGETTEEELTLTDTGARIVCPITLVCTEPVPPESTPMKLTEWKQNWFSSQDHANLVKCIADKKNLSEVTKIICFGLGSPTNNSGYEEVDRERCSIQHLAVCAIAEQLKSRGDSSIKIFAQDPVYNGRDKEDLTTFHPPIEVMDDAKALLEIDEHTIVVSIGTGFPLRQIVADLYEESGKCPTGVWWNDFYDMEGADPPSRKVKKMMEKYEVAWKPVSDGKKNWLAPSMLAWRTS
ncbi:hypothetical protein BDV96DRAFT_598546 [Lophiotrema nucula]|uniref:SRR1-like domain-containing protein n=1 Tax=Lophiotrema nucula TaxID=690887 RepID=A0A6A5ZBS3_9PLEO|nr:hypothetical protein BDV96DRAFT_598546 [Lophiotrema nucula]